mmetsp:Transcript_129439/g.360544  ORF Transcript_129439/g.360544 Transcript_129439/m.360544 type:complete len:290 (-) Transcript_129439:182-1051(-)
MLQEMPPPSGATGSVKPGRFKQVSPAAAAFGGRRHLVRGPPGSPAASLRRPGLQPSAPVEARAGRIPAGTPVHQPVGSDDALDKFSESLLATRPMTIATPPGLLDPAPAFVRSAFFAGSSDSSSGQQTLAGQPAAVTPPPRRTQGSVGTPYCPGETLKKTSLLVPSVADCIAVSGLDAGMLFQVATASARVNGLKGDMPVATGGLQLPWRQGLAGRPAPVLGSPELPTVGSASHHLRLCKPCAFVATKGCKDGASCKFCHLCEPGEKKRRKKEKHAFWRALNRWESMVA